MNIELYNFKLQNIEPQNIEPQSYIEKDSLSYSAVTSGYLCGSISCGLKSCSSTFLAPIAGLPAMLRTGMATRDSLHLNDIHQEGESHREIDIAFWYLEMETLGQQRHTNHHKEAKSQNLE